jgi:mannose-6-phosphate isomerase-like protein (cupin superfamily)
MAQHLFHQSTSNFKHDLLGKIGVKHLLNNETHGFFVVRLAPGATIAAHYRRKSSEVYFVLRGQGTLLTRRLGDNQVYADHIRRGEAFRIDAGVVHQLINSHDKPLMMVITCPAQHLGDERVITGSLAADMPPG